MKRAASQPGGTRKIIARIEGVGGLAEPQELEFRSGTTNRIAGKNAVGKSTAGQAIAFALGDPTVEPEINDGADIGTVEVLEVDSSDGHEVGKVSAVIPSRGRVRRKGEPSVETSERAVRALDILLTGDHAKSAETRNKARIQAFLTLVRPALDAPAAKLLCEGDSAYIEWLLELVRSGQVTDLLVGAKELQSRLQREARDQEAAAQSWAGKAAGAAEQAASRRERLPEATPADILLQPDPAAARADLSKLQIALAESRRDAAARLEKEEMQRLVRERGVPRPDVAAAEAETRGFLLTRDAARTEVQSINEEIARLEARAEAALAREAQAVEQGKVAEARWRSLRDAAEAWDAQQRLLAEDITGPGPEQVAAIEGEVARAAALVRAHEIAADLLSLEASEEDAKLQAARAETKAKELRAWNAAVPQRVADVLARSGAGGFTIADGFLAFRGAEGGEPRDFDSRLSPGEKVKAAFPLVAQHLGGWALISGEIYRAWLDDQGRLDVEAWAAAHPDVFVITEEPTAKGLRVVYGPFVQEGGA